MATGRVNGHIRPVGCAAQEKASSHGFHSFISGKSGHIAEMSGSVCNLDERLGPAVPASACLRVLVTRLPLQLPSSASYDAPVGPRSVELTLREPSCWATLFSLDGRQAIRDKRLFSIGAVSLGLARFVAIRLRDRIMPSALKINTVLCRLSLAG